ncbi:MAG: DUF3050 domain-containing protein [Gammaproteobacteria bacterium]
MRHFDTDLVAPQQEALERHPIYGALRSLDDLRLFMAHHVYSVWDFMSLIKQLQDTVAPTRVPWTPVGDPEARYFINQLCLEEESDEIRLPDGTVRHASHFESYCEAMAEIGADAQAARDFVAAVERRGLDAALADPAVPEPSRRFTRTTFELIRSGRPHAVAAALALGRERIIPSMFRRFLADMAISAEDAPAFHFYLNRHIHLDEDFHGPLSIRLVDALCGGDETRLREAEHAARAALDARAGFWDGVLNAVEARRPAA